jgi:exosortase A
MAEVWAVSMPMDISFLATDPSVALTQRRRWFFAVGCLLMATLVLVFLFFDAVARAVDVWWTSTAYNHCFLIIPISLYMAWTCRHALDGLPPKPEFRFLWLTLPLSGLWLFAAMLGILEFQQFAILAMFQVIAVSVLGWRIYRILLGPLLFLFFLVPSGQVLVPWLQAFTAHFVVVALRLTGIPVFGDGVTIEIPAGTFMVAEACAGLRFLVASVAFGVLFSWLVYRGIWRRLAFIALSIVVPVIANGLRCYGILMLAELLGDAKAALADHIIYGWGFFSAVTIVLILIGFSFSDRPQSGHREAASSVPLRSEARPSWVTMLATLLGVLGAAVGPAYAGLASGHGASVSLADVGPPQVAPPWRASPGASPWRPIIFAASRTFLGEFTNGGARVTRYVALYRRRLLRDNLVRGENRIADEKRWVLLGSGEAAVTVQGRIWHVATTELGRGIRHLLVWHFYVVDGRVVAGPSMAKLWDARAALFGGAPVSALYAVAATEDDPSHPAGQVLAQFLNAMPPPANYLRRLARSR